MNNAKTRQSAYRMRQREGRVLAAVEVGPAEIFALQRLNLLPANRKPDKGTVGEAVRRFLTCAPVIAAISDDLQPG